MALLSYSVDINANHGLDVKFKISPFGNNGAHNDHKFTPLYDEVLNEWIRIRAINGLCDAGLTSEFEKICDESHNVMGRVYIPSPAVLGSTLKITRERAIERITKVFLETLETRWSIKPAPTHSQKRRNRRRAQRARARETPALPAPASVEASTPVYSEPFTSWIWDDECICDWGELCYQYRCVSNECKHLEAKALWNLRLQRRSPLKVEC